MLLSVAFLRIIILLFLPVVFTAPANLVTRKILQSTTGLLVSSSAQSSNSMNTSSVRLSQLNAPPIIHLVRCFHPIPIPFERAVAADCLVIVDSTILRLDFDPFATLSWGYTNKQDINLSLQQNQKWHYDKCVIFVRGADDTLVDHFRIIDVAATAQSIINDCVIGTKEGFGGTADIGTMPTDSSYYVVVGGIEDFISNSPGLSPPTNETAPFMSLNKTVLSLSRNTE